MRILITHLLLGIWLCFFSFCGTEKGENSPSEHINEPIDSTLSIKDLTAQIDADPDNADLYYNRAMEWFNNYNTDKAIIDMERALRLDSTQEEFYHFLAEIFIQSGDAQRAALTYEKAADQFPDIPDFNAQAGKLHLYGKNYQAALNFLNKALKAAPFDAELYFVKALLFKDTGDTAKAISNLQTAVEQDPDFIRAYLLLGAMLSDRDDELALQYYGNVLAIDSANAGAMYGCGMVHQSRKRHLKAIEWYKKIVALDPQKENAHYNIGWNYYMLDSVEKASKSFDLAIKVAPTYADAFYMAGLCAEELGNKALALNRYQECLRLDDQHRLANERLNKL